MREQAAIDNFKVDRTNWPQGEWDQEPDRIEWRDGGFPCLMSRHPTAGHWCGYIGVTKDHPWFNKSYDDVDASVHGGLTYAALCEGHICHVPQESEDPNVWWLGFDCAHAGDMSPGIRGMLTGFGLEGAYRESYRNVDYVKAEVAELIKQAMEAGA
jgi:hypothetical protein